MLRIGTGIRGIAGAAKTSAAVVKTKKLGRKENEKQRPDQSKRFGNSLAPRRKLRSADFPVSVEIDPPVGTDCAPALIAAARTCQDHDVDCINIASGHTSAG